MWTVETLALVTITFLIGGLVKGALGLGLPPIALAFMAAPLGVKAAMGIMLGPTVITNVWQALAGPSLGELLRRLWSFLLAAFVGIWFGVDILAATSSDFLLGALGLLLSIYSLLSLVSPQIPPPGKREKVLSPIAGGVGGVVFGFTGTFIVPGVLYLQALGLNRDTMVQALGLTFVTISVALAISFTRHQLVPSDVFWIALYAVCPTVVGLVLGTRFRHKISEAQFRQYFFIALLLAGLYMLVRAIYG
ncbi:MAG: sulfite exporter TauE/SafE family protein [Pseudomonadota bacterium]